jgi:RsiW-degrading membrane proteinase PrsW (M82 family)
MGPVVLFSAIILSALVSVIVWIDYFRHIDVFEPEKIRHLVIALLVGCGTPYLSILIYDFHDTIKFALNGEPVNDLIYSILGIGLTEELSKVVGVIIAFQLIRKQVNESVDYLIYAGMVALGFALVENTLYIGRYGIDIITDRSFYSVLEHIINTSIITYGYCRFKIFKRGSQVTNTVVAFFTAICSHGLFDYFIMNPTFKFIAPILVIAVYLIGINFWITMLNNAINFSPYFNYSKIHYSSSIFYRLLLWYFFTMIISIFYKTYTHDFTFAIKDSFSAVFSNGFLFVLVILRVSRFKIYKNFYQPLSIKLPFYITRNNDGDFGLTDNLEIKIRGENAHEYFLTAKMGQMIEICPINTKLSFLHKSVTVKVSDKLFFDGDTTVYLIEFTDERLNNRFYLKPKTKRKTLVDDVYPINELLHDETPESFPTTISELKFLEWVYVKVDNEISKVNY